MVDTLIYVRLNFFILEVLYYKTKQRNMIIFELLNRSGELSRYWCLRNNIDFEEFRSYASILERLYYVSRHERFVERSFEIRRTPFVEVPFTENAQRFNSQSMGQIHA